jgi:hypothetical protein
MPVPSSITPAASGTTLTDYLTGWGTLALAVVTVAAVIVTVLTAITDRRRDDKRRTEDRDEAENRVREEREYRQKAQARLVITSPPELASVRDSLNRRGIQFEFVNHGDRPVMGIEAEVWLGAAPRDQPCTSADEHKFALPGRDLQLWVPIDSLAPELDLRAWRIRWTDADGREWFVDQAQQPEPLPFTKEPPRPR